MILARIGREYLAQVAAFIVTIADRLFTAGILIRLWGADGFAAWTVALSAAGMLALCDFGLTSYFANRLFFAVEQGDHDRARHVFGAGNAALIAASSFGFILVCAIFYFFGKPVAGMAVDTTLVWTVALLSLATAARQAMAVVMASYRAHQNFFRQTIITISADALRIAATIAAALAGAGILEMALVYLTSMVAMAVVLPLVDTARHYPGFAYGVALPDAEERHSALRTSSLYWAQSGVNTLVTFAPVFFLAGAGASALALAQFALMRTLANLVRAVLQLFANVFGLETARRIAVGDMPGFAQVYRESAIFLAVQTSAAAGLLAALARDLFSVWTGDASLFDPVLFWLAVGPPILLPSLALSVQLASCANMPTPLVFGRLAQLLLTVALFFLLPIDGSGLRMMAALALGELLGLGLPMTLAVRNVDASTGAPLHLQLFLRGLAAGAMGYAGATAGSMLGGTAILPRIAEGLVFGGVGALAATLMLGLGVARRQSLLVSLKTASGRA